VTQDNKEALVYHQRNFFSINFYYSYWYV